MRFPRAVPDAVQGRRTQKQTPIPQQAPRSRSLRRPRTRDVLVGLGRRIVARSTNSLFG